MRRRTLSLACALGSLLVPARAFAVDVGTADGKPVQLDVTETTIVAQHFNARDGEVATDQGYLAWLNRLNVILAWKKLTFERWAEGPESITDCTLITIPWGCSS